MLNINIINSTNKVNISRFLLRLFIYLVLSLIIGNSGYNKKFYVARPYQEGLSNLMNFNKLVILSLVPKESDYCQVLKFIGVNTEAVIILNKNTNLKENSINLHLSVEDAVNNAIKYFLAIVIDSAQTIVGIVLSLIMLFISILYSDWGLVINIFGYINILLLHILIHPFVHMYYIITMLLQPCTIGYVIAWLILSVLSLFALYFILYAVFGGINASKECVRWLFDVIVRRLIVK